MNVIDHPSPNFNARPPDVEITAVVLHGTAGSSVESDLAWLCDEARGADGEPIDTSASYHHLVGRGGEKYQLVDEAHRAWHAGESSWQGRPDLNSYSIGVGLTNRGPVGVDPRNPGIEPFPTVQIMSAAELLVDIFGRHRLPWRSLLGHALVSPGRKHDPWLHFPWGELAGAMLSYQRIRGGE